MKTKSFVSLVVQMKVVRSQTGSTIVEFAIVLFVLLPFMVATMGFTGWRFVDDYDKRMNVEAALDAVPSLMSIQGLTVLDAEGKAVLNPEFFDPGPGQDGLIGARRLMSLGLQSVEQRSGINRTGENYSHDVKLCSHLVEVECIISSGESHVIVSRILSASTAGFETSDLGCESFPQACSRIFTVENCKNDFYIIAHNVADPESIKTRDCAYASDVLKIYDGSGI